MTRAVTAVRECNVAGASTAPAKCRLGPAAAEAGAACMRVSWHLQAGLMLRLPAASSAPCNASPIPGWQQPAPPQSLRAHLGQQAAVEVGHDLSHTCARGLGGQLDHRPGGAKHQAQAVYHVEEPGHSNVGVLQQVPAMQHACCHAPGTCHAACMLSCSRQPCWSGATAMACMNSSWCRLQALCLSRASLGVAHLIDAASCMQTSRHNLSHTQYSECASLSSRIMQTKRRAGARS